MRSALLDTGALVAFVNRRDRSHSELSELLRHYDGRFLTTWPVVTEACSFMRDEQQRRVLDWLSAAAVDLVSIDAGLEFMRQIMMEYADLPCDFADASLIYAASIAQVREVWTLDRDFLVFRLPDRSRFTPIPGAKPADQFDDHETEAAWVAYPARRVARKGARRARVIGSL